MNGNYIWQTAYLAAVCETKDELMMGRILEARAAIEQRLLVPIEQDGAEYRGIVAAEKALEVLKSERVDKSERPHTFAPVSSQPTHELTS